jgi:hypothetical protein
VCAWPDDNNDYRNDNNDNNNNNNNINNESNSTTTKTAADATNTTTSTTTSTASTSTSTTSTTTTTNSLWPTLLIFVNVMGTFATALLFTLDPEQYEVVTHYMEYTLQIMISAVNWIFVHHLTSTAGTSTTTITGTGTGTGDRRRATTTGRRWSNPIVVRHYELGTASVIVALSFVTVFLYSGALPMGSVEPERAGHFAEFVNEILNGLFAFLYAAVSYMDANAAEQQQQQQHYYSMLV